MQSVEEGGGRDLGGLLAGRVEGPRASHGRSHGVHGHSIVGRHDVGMGARSLPGRSRPVGVVCGSPNAEGAWSFFEFEVLAKGTRGSARGETRES